MAQMGPASQGITCLMRILGCYLGVSGDIMVCMADRAMALRFSEELWLRMEEARGLVPREPWVRRAVEQALGASSVGADAALSSRGVAEAGPIPVPAPAVPSRKSRKASVKAIDTSGVRSGRDVTDRVPARVYACRHCGAQAYEAPGVECDVHGAEMEFVGVSGARGLLPFREREDVFDDFDF